MRWASVHNARLLKCGCRYASRLQDAALMLKQVHHKTGKAETAETELASAQWDSEDAKHHR